MTERVHVAQADPNVSEKGIQVLSENPAAEYLGSHPGLIWLNSTDKSFYLEQGGSAVELGKDTDLSGYALISHSHAGEYADLVHTHSQYAESVHSHSEYVADVGEASFETSFECGGFHSASHTVRLYRNGKQVTMYLPAITMFTCGSIADTQLLSDTAMPSQYIPSDSLQAMAPVFVIDNDNVATSPMGYVSISSAGRITVRRNALHSNFTASSGVGTARQVIVRWLLP